MMIDKISLETALAEEDPTLKSEIEFFESQKESLLKTHPGQYALVVGRKPVGVYTTEEEAYRAGLKEVGNKPFLIRQIRDEEPRFQVPLISVGINLGPRKQ